MRVRNIIPGGLALLLLASTPVMAQLYEPPPPAEDLRGLELSGVELRLGPVDPSEADVGFKIGGALDWGNLFEPWLNLWTGATYWSADVDRFVSGTRASGKLSDVELNADMRVVLLRSYNVQPYALFGLGGHIVSADIPASTKLQEDLDGFKLGANLGVGAAAIMDSGLRLSAELRREYANDVGSWGVMAGIGWTKFAPSTSTSAHVQRGTGTSGVAGR